MKKIAVLLIAVMVMTMLAACGERKERLRVYNVGMYIDKSTIRDFEREFNVKVIYDEFNTNEEMYVKIAMNENAYDILVPSDYMIDRLIQEGRLAKLNTANIPNFNQ